VSFAACHYHLKLLWVSVFQNLQWASLRRAFKYACCREFVRLAVFPIPSSIGTRFSDLPECVGLTPMYFGVLVLIYLLDSCSDEYGCCLLWLSKKALSAFCLQSRASFNLCFDPYPCWPLRLVEVLVLVRLSCASYCCFVVQQLLLIC
jgi:hypothetical protein